MISLPSLFQQLPGQVVSVFFGDGDDMDVLPGGDTVQKFAVRHLQDTVNRGVAVQRLFHSTLEEFCYQGKQRCGPVPGGTCVVNGKFLLICFQ